MAFALVDHRLDGENHAGLQDDALSFSAVVQDLRGFVETASDAVAAKFLYDGVACVFGNLLAGVADVAQGRAGFDGGDARHHGFVGDVNQALGDGGDFADGKHAAGVAVEAVFFDGQVDVDDVAFFERLVVGNAVADDVVDGGAAGFGVGRVAVVQGGGIAALDVDVVVVNEFVDFVGGYAGFDELSDVVEGFGNEFAQFAHFLDFFGGFDDDFVHVVSLMVSDDLVAAQRSSERERDESAACFWNTATRCADVSAFLDSRLMPEVQIKAECQSALE